MCWQFLFWGDCPFSKGQQNYPVGGCKTLPRWLRKISTTPPVKTENNFLTSVVSNKTSFAGRAWSFSHLVWQISVLIHGVVFVFLAYLEWLKDLCKTLHPGRACCRCTWLFALVSLSLYLWCIYRFFWILRTCKTSYFEVVFFQFHEELPILMHAGASCGSSCQILECSSIDVTMILCNFPS